jgi:hypothetical protein
LKREYTMDQPNATLKFKFKMLFYSNFLEHCQHEAFFYDLDFSFKHSFHFLTVRGVCVLEGDYKNVEKFQESMRRKIKKHSIE